MDIILNEIEESRIAHRLGGDTNIAEPEEASTLSLAAPVSAERIEKLELAVESLQNELEDLKKSFRTFIAQNQNWGSSLRLTLVEKCQRSNVDLTPNSNIM